jgi:hypothetical protein
LRRASSLEVPISLGVSTSLPVSSYGFDDPSSSFGLWHARRHTYLDLEVFPAGRSRTT